MKKWHIGRFDSQQNTLPKRRNAPVAPYRFEGSPLVHYNTRLNDWLAYISENGMYYCVFNIKELLDSGYVSAGYSVNLKG